MKERTVEQFFKDVEEVHNLDKYELTPACKPRKIISKREVNKKHQLIRDKRKVLLEEVSQIIIKNAKDKWINNTLIYEQLPIENTRSFMYRYTLTREAKETLVSKGYIIKTKGKGRYMEWCVERTKR